MASFAPTDEMPADAPAPQAAGTPTDEVPLQPGNPSQWGPAMEGVNAAMGGMGLPVREWVRNHLPSSWLDASPNSAAVMGQNEEAWKQQNPKTAMAANLIGGSLPYLAAGEAMAPLGVGARMLGMGATGAGLQGGAAALQGQDPTMPAIVGAASGAGGEGLGSAVTAAGGKLASAILNRGVNVPTSSALRDVANSQYKNLQANMASMPLAEGKQFGQDTVNSLGAKWLDRPAQPRNSQPSPIPLRGRPASQPEGSKAPDKTLTRSSANSPELQRLQRREWVNKALTSWLRLKQPLIRLGLLSPPTPRPLEEIGPQPKVRILSPGQSIRLQDARLQTLSTIPLSSFPSEPKAYLKIRD